MQMKWMMDLHLQLRNKKQINLLHLHLKVHNKIQLGLELVLHKSNLILLSLL
jgi:hypothetical protein